MWPTYNYATSSATEDELALLTKYDTLFQVYDYGYEAQNEGIPKVSNDDADALMPKLGIEGLFMSPEETSFAELFTNDTWTTGASNAAEFHRMIKSKELERNISSFDNASTASKRQYEISGLLNGIRVHAILDTGSSLNIISAAVAKRGGFKINRAATGTIKLPTGRKIPTLGTVQLPFSFEDEESVYIRTFTVMKQCVHGVILGEPFLRLTKSFSSGGIPRHCSIDTPPKRVCGFLNGIEINALPDTGSDVMAISKDAAKRYGLHIERDDEHRTVLQLADGSLHCTYGMVLNAHLQFSSVYFELASFLRNLHVVDQLSCDLILSNEFLFNNDIFNTYSHCFWELDGSIISHHDGEDNVAEVNLIRNKPEKKSVTSYLVNLFNLPSRGSPSTGTNQGPTEEERELYRLAEEEDRIATLSPSQQLIAWEVERNRRESWHRTHGSPNNASLNPPTTTNSASANPTMPSSSLSSSTQPPPALRSPP